MANRKKIALCLEYPLALRGGVSVLVETLMAGLAGDYDLVLVSPDTVENLANSPAKPFIHTHLPWNPATVSRRTSQDLARQLAAAGVQLAHFHFGGNFGWGSRFIGHCPIPYAARLGIPTVSTIHSFHGNLDGFCGPQKPFWFKLALFPFAWLGKMHVLSHLRREIAVSRTICQKLRRLYWPFRGKFIQLYHSRLKPGGVAEKKPRENLILNVGHIAAMKGQVFLAEAFAQLAPRHPDWKLCLVGHVAEPATAQEIVTIARTHNLADRILLPGESSEVHELMRRARIYVQPSLSEALGLALQEAMFYGACVIGTRTGGIPELIQHAKTGLLVEPANVPQLTAALENLIAHPSLREDYGRAGAAAIPQMGMTAAQMSANHIRLYESILVHA
ncbi:MAG: hypothetical protein JWR19_1414 [Pedosphaera sp.]|nr:hypothetical protein [Pedosphaera sp.]